MRENGSKMSKQKQRKMNQKWRERKQNVGKRNGIGLRVNKNGEKTAKIGKMEMTKNGETDQKWVKITENKERPKWGEKMRKMKQKWVK